VGDLLPERWCRGPGGFGLVSLPERMAVEHNTGNGQTNQLFRAKTAPHREYYSTQWEETSSNSRKHVRERAGAGSKKVMRYNESGNKQGDCFL